MEAKSIHFFFFLIYTNNTKISTIFIPANININYIYDNMNKKTHLN